MDRKRVLLVEDSRNDAFLHGRLLTHGGGAAGIEYEVAHVETFQAALERLADERAPIDVVLLDLGLPDGDGLGTVGTLRERFPAVPVVILSGLDDVQIALEAVTHGAQDYLIKGNVRPEALARALNYAIVRAELEQALRESEHEHRALFECNPHPIWVYDVDTLEFIDVNAATERLYGWRREELLRMRVADLLPAEDQADFLAALGPRAGGSVDDGIRRHRTRDGRLLQVRTDAHPLRFRGRAACLVLGTDVTDAQRAIQALAASEQRYRELFEMSLGLICEHDLDGKLRSVNPAAAAALGYLPGELRGRHLRDIVPERFQDGVRHYLDAIERDGEFSGLLTVATRDGRWLVWRFHNRLRIDAGRAPYVIGYAHDVTEAMRREESLRDQSLTDPLTQARNRRFLEFAGASGQLSDWGCVVVDLDHFKEINDTQGHQRGDEVLVDVVAFLQAHARRDDIVIRTGGDEFLVLLSNESARYAGALAARLSAAAGSAPCGLSIGSAVRSAGETLEQTIARADAELYATRRRARGDAAEGRAGSR